jgi:hypothetical protein
MSANSRRLKSALIVGLVATGSLLLGNGCPIGLSLRGFIELHQAGVDKYLGDFTPVSSVDVGDGWTRHTFDTAGGDGPICIAGTPYSVYTKIKDPNKVLFFEQGGGACWQNFYFCNVFAEAQPPPPIAPGADSGIWVDSFDTGSEVIENPLKDWSIVYLPYCDGSVFSGDNTVVDPSFPAGGVRHHRGLRNLTAAINVAATTFPGPHKVLLAGSSAGGVGVAGFSPFLARFVWGNGIQLYVLNDAGPVAVNLAETAAIQARANDWQFGQFYPASCTDCDVLGQATEIIKWRLNEDFGVREGFYSTDGDATDRFFLNVPTQEAYRELIVTEHGLVRQEAPLRYKRFIRSGDTEHTALQLPTFYVGEANGFPLHLWVKRMVNTPVGVLWPDIVEDFVPAP